MFSLADPRWLWLLLLPVALAPAVFYSRRFFRPLAAGGMVGLRVLVVLCLALAAGGLVLKKTVRSSAVLLLADHSHSVDPAEAQRRDVFVQQSLATAGARRRLGVLAFGAQPTPLALPSTAPKLAEGALVEGGGTDIEAALRQAMLYLPPTGRRRVVLLSDGLPTMGRAEEAAQALKAADIEISTLTLQPNREPDVALTQLEAPARRREKEPVRLTATLHAPHAQKGVVRFYEDGQPVGAVAVELQEGVNQVSLDRLAQDSGFHTYEAVFDHPQDAHRQNNRQGAFTYVDGPERVLLSQGEGGGPQSPLALALRQQGVAVDAIGGAAPVRAEDLLRYNTVVLDNLPAAALAPGQMGLMREMVHGLGRGLVMVGGQDSFGPGGYHGTPIAAALPVDMRLMTRRRVPSLAIVFVVDKSGSMADFDAGGQEKIALAREAVTLALEVILPGDLVGVVGFDSAAKWVLPAAPLKNLGAAKAQVRTMQPGGGTDMYPGLAMAFEALKAARAMYKHVIVLSDGQTNPADFESLLGAYNQEKITLTAVGIGQDADRPFLESIARLGQGRVYFPTSAQNLPQLYTRETSLAYRAYLVQEPFTPRVAAWHQVLGGMRGFPQLLGYTGTSPKSTARHLLVSHKKDPLLSVWQYGTGRSAAFTSDSGLRWAQPWTSWGGFGPFFTQLVRWTSGGGQQGAGRLALGPAGDGHLKVSLEAAGEEGEAPQETTLNLRLLDPEGKARTVSLRRTGPGRYEGRLPGEAEGVYLGRAAGAAGGFSAVVGAYVGGGAEVAPRLPEENVLGQLAAITGGRELAGVEEIWEGIAASRPEEIPLHQWLVLIAGLLWVVDVAVRRFNLQSRVVQQALAATAERAKEVLAAPHPEVVAAPRSLDTLLKSKQASTSRAEQRAKLLRKKE